MFFTTERPKSWQVARRAWVSLFAALRQMAPLFLIGLGLMVGLNIAIDRLQTLLAIPTHDALKEIITNGRRLPWLNVSKAMAMDSAVLILRAIVAAPIALAVHRFILLGEVRRIYFFSRLSLRLARWVFVLTLPILVLSWLILFATGAAGLPPLLYLLMFALIIFTLQSLQLFPGLAVEEPSDTPSGRVETALERAEQMFWLTIFTLVLTFLPVALVQMIAVRAFAKLAEHAPLIVPVARALAGFIAVTLGAATISWLYSYGAQLPREKRQPSASPATHGAGGTSIAG